MEVFEDPLSLEIKEAVVSKVCGHSFSNDTIRSWLATHNTCPICSNPMKVDDLKPNYKLREAIEYSTQILDLKAEYEEDPTIVELLPLMEEEATITYARAFIHNPWFDYFLGVNHNQFESVKWFCGQIVKYGLTYGRLWARVLDVNGTKKVQGLAVWQPPNDQGVSLIRMLQHGFAAAPFKFGMGPSWRAVNSLVNTEKVHNEIIPNEPHWYLFCIGVDPPYQNNGIGTKIIQPILHSADKSGLKCYLDTSSKRSIGFFQRCGFEVVKEIKGETGPVWWVMIRNPKSKNTVT